MMSTQAFDDAAVDGSRTTFSVCCSVCPFLCSGNVTLCGDYLRMPLKLARHFSSTTANEKEKKISRRTTGLSVSCRQRKWTFFFFRTTLTFPGKKKKLRIALRLRLGLS